MFCRVVARLLLASVFGFSMAFETIDKGTHSGIEDALETAVTSEAEWGDMWRRHTSKTSPAPPVPHVDFQQHMVVYVALGTCNSGGHAVEVKGVEQTAEALVVSYETEAPNGGMTTCALTQPYHMVRVAKTALPVQFVRSAKAPPARPPTFMLTFVDKGSAAEVMSAVKELDIVESTNLLGAVGIGIVNIFAEKADGASAALAAVKGVASVEQDG
eukprot:TRINITY_DN234_c1_g1_i1.p1 TRINITY_DN234_c1_g1~~TRINITY_DN234_c1_g1_i1.p1  ORF type:complete len:223 (+),score=49.28 TRINITY_DN234_c1_g1_i1:25-669(+)